MSDHATPDLAMIPQTGSQWSREVNAGIAYFLDVIVNVFLLASLLIGAFKFPAHIVFEHIVPGSIAGIIVGNILMILAARHVAKATNNPAVTAIPLGLDMPTLFGMVFFVLGPVFNAKVGEIGPEAAATLAWKIGMAGTLWIAIFKFIISFFGQVILRVMPHMALIGAMVAIATVWLGADSSRFQSP